VIEWASACRERRMEIEKIRVKQSILQKDTGKIKQGMGG
jgi:hypothetical protein